MTINVNVNFNLFFDEETRTYTIENQNVQVQMPENLPLRMERKLGVAEKRYGILTLGSKSTIGQVLPRDTDITVVHQGTSYPAHTHSTSGGRIDRLSSLTRLFSVGNDLVFEYDPAKKELNVSKK